LNILGKHVLLRAIAPEDLALLNRWANDYEIQRLLGGWHFPTSMKDQEDWYAKLSCNSVNQRFAIETDDQGLIGTANLVSIDWKNRNAFHGMLLGDRSLRGRGYGVDTIMAIMRYAFDQLGLNRLDTDIIEYNETSLKVYTEKCGWQIEGCRPQWYFRDGRCWDKIIVGISRQRYAEFTESIGYWR
jgi:RimJ/RimL family protein N-acetyltransferase